MENQSPFLDPSETEVTGQTAAQGTGTEEAESHGETSPETEAMRPQLVGTWEWWRRCWGHGWTRWRGSWGHSLGGTPRSHAKPLRTPPDSQVNSQEKSSSVSGREKQKRIIL